jgi:putative endonuclease
MRAGNYVYILSNQGNSVFYIGVTNDLERRIREHKTSKDSSFTRKYNVSNLLYFEKLESMESAIRREKQLKNWHRDWKINLIREQNPEMNDLAEDWWDSETSSE